ITPRVTHLCHLPPINPPSFPTRRSSDLKRPQLLIGIHRFHQNENVESRRAGSFQVTPDPQFLQFFMQRSRDRDDHGKIRAVGGRSEEHTSELQSLAYLVCRLLLEKKNKT